MKQSNAAIARKANRTVAVFVSLVAMVAFTTVLLVLLAPPPLTTPVWHSLFAVDAPPSLDVVFTGTEARVEPGRWRTIYVHHSRTAGGDAVGLAQPPGGWDDHFVIGNGDGAVDGEVQMTQRWNRQQPITAPPPGVAKFDPACVSICLVGDFSRTPPTASQRRRLAQLVDTLQAQLHVPGNRVLLYDDRNGPAGVGRAFPTAEFRGQLLR